MNKSDYGLRGMQTDSNMKKVRLRGGFSDRAGLQSENTSLQLTELDDRTRMALRNTISRGLDAIVINNNELIMYRNRDIVLQHILKCILADIYLEKVNYSSFYDAEYVMNYVFKTITDDTYDSVLTVIEFVAKLLHNSPYGKDARVYNTFNNVFEKEFVGYRFVDGLITPITDEIEVEEIDNAITFLNIQTKMHIRKSLEKLSDRENPDYENSIKESITAVESICSTIIGKGATLGEALKKLEGSGLAIHPALKSAFITLYGYTSDGKGIRHSGQIGGKDATFEEAKFMLVSCCAFVNYLVGAMSKLSSS